MQAARLVAEQGAALVDVREPGEWDAGHAPGALHVPLDQVPERVAEIPTPPTTVVVVCRSGYRSALAAAWLRGQGRDAVNLAGGLLDWAQAGLPLVSGADEPG